MTEAVAALDVLQLPLQGSRLIEASAGTGKTWTISALMLRLVAGLGCEPRTPEQILVMSFTKAATGELAGRIRERLAQAAQALQHDDEGPGLADDGFLARLKGAFAPGPAREQAAWRLAMAAQTMDEASIFTIDAWCQRMLREHAFDSGSLFDETLEPHEEAMRSEAVRDVWRRQVYPLADEALAMVLQRWPDLQALQQDMRAFIDKPIAHEAGEGSLAERLQTAAAARQQRLAALKAGWPQRIEQMRAWLAEVWDNSQHPARKALPTRANATRWLLALQAWAQDPGQELPDLKAGAERLSASRLRADLDALGLPGMAPPAPFAQLQELLGHLQRLPDPEPAMRLHLAATVSARLQALKARAGRFGHADALRRLERALDPALNGQRADRLRERILERYPVAMIDEFQDTSAVQLRIFDRLYRIADDDPARTLLLIADPKQAIYGFRGADIHSYLRARAATAGRHHALTTNHRSTQALVQAVNRLFLGAQTRARDGAFRFTPPGGDSPLPFVPVQARGLPQRLVGADGELAPITMVADLTRGSRGEGRPGKEQSRRRLAALCAERIVTLLNDPAVGFAAEGRPLQRLQPGDIAVLVHNRTEAEAVRAQMTQRGLASVYLSDRESVFASDEAADLLRLMQAAHQPGDLRLVRAALATALLCLPLEELLRLAQDDARLELQCERLRQLGEAWRSRGILAMVRDALHAFGLPALWLAQDGQAGRGERRLTNVLHLAELLQAAAPQARTPQAMIGWLRTQIEQADQAPENDEQLLRLESDAGRVQVVTIHKSKGLQYPLVFLPFATQFQDIARNARQARDLVLMLPGTGAQDAEPELVLSPSAEQIQAARLEQRREQLRLFYVAVTRARHMLWLGLSDHPSTKTGSSGEGTWPESALGHLLRGADGQADPTSTEETTSSRIWREIQAHAASGGDVALQAVDGSESDARPALTRLMPREPAPPLAEALHCNVRFDRDWAVSSYSRLLKMHAGPAAPEAAAAAHESGRRPLREDEPEAFDLDASSGWDGAPIFAAAAAGTQGEGTQDDRAAPWHRFPPGAQSGDFLHAQLQWLAAQRFLLDESPDLQQRLRQRCDRPGWSRHAEDVVAWLREVCRQRLPALDVPLSGLRSAVAEMEFWFPSDGLSLKALDDLCRRHLLNGQARPPLSDRRLKGLMMGFADLVFEHGGRYWVLDYKSNRLGPGDGDYGEAALCAAVAQHRYDVQAALYLLALHRLLRARLGPRYRPAAQLGGAIFLFLRGIRGPQGGGLSLPASAGLIQALDALITMSPDEGAQALGAGGLDEVAQAAAAGRAGGPA